MINKEKAAETFLKYTSGYNPENPKIRLKVDHTLRVAGLSEEIARSITASRDDRDLAYLIGLLHDIGRFEQVRIYHTFLDAKSVDHAALSADLLFRDGMIKDYHSDEKDYELIGKAIRLHNAYRLPNDLTDRERMFCQILRDADKIDIVRVNRETPMTQIYDLPEEAFLTSAISDPVYEDLMAHRDVNRANSKTAVDHLMGHIAFVFGIVYPVSIRLIREQGYLEEMLGFESRNEETRIRMMQVRREVHQYILDHMETKRKVLIYGDSNTYGYDPADFAGNRYPAGKRWTTLLQEKLGDRWEVLPEGLNGRKLPDLKYDRDRILRLMRNLSDDDIFAVMLGTNDLLLTMDPDAGEAVRKMQEFLSFLTEHTKPDHILVIAPPNIASGRIRDPLYRLYFEESVRMNEGFRILTDQYGTMFADAGTWGVGLSADLVHFSEEGHRTFAGKMAEYIGERFDPRFS